eukprot:m.228957 g.228957  ORF g.228957 m.228957 type:complete len:127 (-) comp15198_c0_seq4:104-484(-)
MMQSQTPNSTRVNAVVESIFPATSSSSQASNSKTVGVHRQYDAQCTRKCEKPLHVQSPKIEIWCSSYNLPDTCPSQLFSSLENEQICTGAQPNLFQSWMTVAVLNKKQLLQQPTSNQRFVLLHVYM